jgi:2-phosphoglycerate kinase
MMQRMVIPEMRRLVLIGGAALTGKSTLASSLSKKLGIPWVSTDDIRKWMQALVRKEDYPDLFISVGISASEFYATHTTPQAVLERSLAESAAVAKGVTALLDSFWWWPEVIIEGIAITPAYVREVQASHPAITVTPVFLVDRDQASIKQRLDKRGLWDKAGTYPAEVKPYELAFSLLNNEYYEREATNYGCPLYENAKLHDVEQKLLINYAA